MKKGGRMKRWGSIALVIGAYLVAASGIVYADDKGQNARLAKAEAMFAERCKKAGEFIHRTVDGVEGVFLMKLRPEKKNYSDQFLLDDPYGKDLRGMGYIESFIRGQFMATHTGTSIPGSPPPPSGYLYVEAVDPVDGKRYRYTGSMKVVGRKNPNTPNHQIELQRNPKFDLNNYAFMLDKVPSPGMTPRYGVTYDDISTREEREYWIAGSSLKVIDLQTNEVIAERVGYMMDRGQGNNSGGRAPWLLAADHACPAFSPRHGSTAQPYQTVTFIEKALQPKKGK